MPRRLIICADGTWNTADAPAPTNVTKLTRAIKPVTSAGISQIVYYHAGVGTRLGLDRLLGGVCGLGVSENICDCYRFLVNNYAVGDDILLFGFSRGAYTVRSLAGFIRNCGLLRLEHADRIQEAYTLYRDRDDTTHPGGEQAQQFRDNYAHEVRIKCLGVWDTVGALGVPVSGLNRLFLRKYKFHDVCLSSWIDNAFHAIAIDEHRKPFAPTLWETQGLPEQTVEQVWFSGAHSNVGGGYPDSHLSDVALLWMKERVEKTCELEFDPYYVAQTLAPAYDGELYNSLSWWYRLFGAMLRPIARARHSAEGTLIDTKETVHSTALERHENLSTPPHGPYRPQNLLAYLQAHAPDPLQENAVGAASQVSSMQSTS